MEELLPSQWIATCAERLHGRWQTVDPAQLEEVAVEMWKNDYLRSMGPAEAAAFWLTPVAVKSDSNEHHN